MKQLRKIHCECRIGRLTQAAAERWRTCYATGMEMRSEAPFTIKSEGMSEPPEIYRIWDMIGDYDPFLEVARWRKLQWFGHTTRRPGSLARHDVIYDVMT